MTEPTADSERRSLNDIAWDIIQIAPEAEPLCEEFFVTVATGRVLGSLSRIRAAAESDADLAKLPALRSFLLAETTAAAYALPPVEAEPVITRAAAVSAIGRVTGMSDGYAAAALDAALAVEGEK